MAVFVYLAPCRDPSDTHNGIIPCETTTATPKTPCLLHWLFRSLIPYRLSFERLGHHCEHARSASASVLRKSMRAQFDYHALYWQFAVSVHFDDYL